MIALPASAELMVRVLAHTAVLALFEKKTREIPESTVTDLVAPFLRSLLVSLVEAKTHSEAADSSMIPALLLSAAKVLVRASVQEDQRVALAGENAMLRSLPPQLTV